MIQKASVIGAGSWGCALALNLAKNGYEVSMWTRSEEHAIEINTKKTNERYLPGITIPATITATTDIRSAIKESELIVLAVPSQAIRSICEEIKDFVKKDQILVDVAKGIEKSTGLKMSEVCNEVLPNIPYSVLSGPSHAEEVARNIPTTVTIASKDIGIARKIQEAFSNDTFRAYTSDDVVGVELGGAFKNIIAFGAGICDGLGYGDNTKAALMTRGLYEIIKLGTAMGANPNSFSGLSGIGDLIVTCTSMHSRNRRAGILIGQGKTLEETLKEVDMVVEGITATEIAYKISNELNISTPIIDAIYSVLTTDEDPKETLLSLMKRDYKTEYNLNDLM